MKSIVTFDEFNEFDLKPSSLIKNYTKLVEKDVDIFILKDNRLRHNLCPGCLGKEISSTFTKFGLHYVECAMCRTLRISPRPNDAVLHRYYMESTARKFWREELSQMTKGKRKEKIVKPRYEWILDSTREYLPDASHILDVNTAQSIVVDEIASIEIFNRKTVLDPFIALDSSQIPGIDVVYDPVYDSKFNDEVDVVTLFEVADRTSDVEVLFHRVHQMLKKDGLCFMTAILISGFDLQVLWDKAENLFPPDRLNVFSVEGLNVLFERHGFRCLEFSTPGILDVEITAAALKEKPDLNLPRFIRYLIQNRKHEARRAFQEFLQSNLLSSYARILLQKL